jgi:RNA polymerase sigma factor (sigma-70 family)
VALSTWLFQVTRYAASTALRAESRRRRHERHAAMSAAQHDENADERAMSPQQWEQLTRMLDDLVARLRREDQRAVLLRFYEQKSYPEMAAAMGVSAEAARKRTDRAVEKLRQLASGRELALSAGGDLRRADRTRDRAPRRPRSRPARSSWVQGVRR